MLVFLLRRLLRIAISMIAVSLITFGLLQLAPGSFADISRITSGGSGAVDADAIGSLQARYGDSVPVWQQYLKFMAGFVTANMGPSYKTRPGTSRRSSPPPFPTPPGSRSSRWCWRWRSRCRWAWSRRCGATGSLTTPRCSP
ncbi:ABC transporter permease family protein [Fodinicola feengrottensis]|uniref:hypothetical protein n=1 Tax=Fodinicola feengrottensis TaxID=435914 RepID=UPI0024418844|nr:hypothetical protein [Fodinicola feengrottensis]